MSVTEAVERDIDALGEKAKGSGFAATALALAGALDGDNSATSKSMCAKALIDVMRELRTLAPPKRQEDKVDEIAKRRQRRLARGGRAAG